jgi:hypothetical protein
LSAGPLLYARVRCSPVAAVTPAMPGRFRTVWSEPDSTGVGAEGRLVFARGGSPAAGVMVAALKQVGGQMVATGLVTGEDISRVVSLLEDPTLIWAMPLMVSAWGQKGQ